MNRRAAATILAAIINMLPALSIYARSLPDPFIQSTVFINNKSTGAAGTGFLVRRTTNKEGAWQLVLISNKHVLMPKEMPPDTQDFTADATLSLTVITDTGITRKDINAVLREKDGKLNVYPHPRGDVDVAGIVLPPPAVFRDPAEQGKTLLTPIPEDRILTSAMSGDNFLTIGDQAIVLGYPLNLVEAGSAIPVARGATISTSPRFQFRNAPVFLIDSAMLRGSSGSPVFLPMTGGKWVEEMKYDVSTMQQSYLLGIVSGTVRDWEMVIRKEVAFGAPPQEFTVLDTANLGIVFNGDTLIEVLDATGVHKWKPEADEPNKKD